MVVPADTRKFHLFLHAAVPGRDRDPRAGLARDMLAGARLASVLQDDGFRPGDAFLNYPEDGHWRAQRPISEYADFDCKFAREGDCWIQPTRPPMHDPVDGYHKQVPRGYTTAELSFMTFWARFFSKISRGEVALSPDVQGSLLAGYEMYRRFELQLNGGCDVTHVDGPGRRGTPPYQGSIAFMLRTEAMSKGAPGLFAAFGMDADATAAFVWKLCDELAEYTRRRGFYAFLLGTPEKCEFRGRYSAIVEQFSAVPILEHDFNE